MEIQALQKVADLSASIDAAAAAGDVVSSLHSLAVLLFPVDSAAVAGALDEQYRSKISNLPIVHDADRNIWRNAFYRGPAFPALSKILLYDIPLKWLAHFDATTRMQVYDLFFSKGPSIEILQCLVPALNQKGNSTDADFDIICTNIERLLILCLLENDGMKQLFQELSCFENNSTVILKADRNSFVSKLAQMVASIPDKARLRSSRVLSSSKFFKKIFIQLLVSAEESAMSVVGKNIDADQITLDPAFNFLTETLSRVCRRGSAGVLVAQMIPRIRDLFQCRLKYSAADFVRPHVVASIPQSHFWMNMIGMMRDQHSVEKLSEEMLRQLASCNITDEEAYWVLHILFDRSFRHTPAMRTLFIDKFLLWKVFPICCLRWILHYAVFDSPPSNAATCDVLKSSHFLSTLQHLVSAWARREFVQSSPMEKQAYITAALGFCLEKMSKNELEASKDVLNLILQGVSCRLESPDDLVRKMASAIALVFSKVVDPKNPLYLDDSIGDTIDWEFGASALRSKPDLSLSRVEITDALQSNGSALTTSGLKSGVPDPVHKAEKEGSKEDDGETMSDDTSLEPYDLSDDDEDLQKKITQLTDLAAALRKSDEPDGVERALSTAEKLVRAAPDELPHIAGDLVRALVHLRCSDVTAEGEEDSAEEQRHRALVALIVTSPLESLDALTKALYSSHVDISQRIVIINVMAEAAQELADTKVVVEPRKNLISATSQPWFVPSSRGPSGAGPWRELSEPDTSMSWYHRYEREVPLKPRQVRPGKSRRWSLAKPREVQVEQLQNRFPLYAAAFMLPAMKGFDKRSHGVDLLNRDFIVLGKIIHMLGVCIRCTSMHPEASTLAPALLDMIKTRSIAHHAEAYVRRSALYAASCILIALHPSAVASALIEGNQEITGGLEWIRMWARNIAETDVDSECSSMAVTCLQLHSEMALQASRVLEAADNRVQGITTAPKLKNIIIPL